MREKNRSDEINNDRRRFLGTAALTVAAAQFGVFGSPQAFAKAVLDVDQL